MYEDSHHSQEERGGGLKRAADQIKPGNKQSVGCYRGMGSQTATCDHWVTEMAITCDIM